jgi:hypothetical protein
VVLVITEESGVSSVKINAELYERLVLYLEQDCVAATLAVAINMATARLPLLKKIIRTLLNKIQPEIDGFQIL